MLRLLIKLYSRRIDYLFFGKTPNCPKLLGLLWYFNFLLKELFLGYLFALLLGAVIPFVDFLSFFSAPKRVHTCIIIIFFCRLSTFVLFFFWDGFWIEYIFWTCVLTFQSNPLLRRGYVNELKHGISSPLIFLLWNMDWCLWHVAFEQQHEHLSLLEAFLKAAVNFLKVEVYALLKC